MGTAQSREAAALLETDFVEDAPPKAKAVAYETFFKDVEELRACRAAYDKAEEKACPGRLPHEFKWWPQDARGLFIDEGVQRGLDGKIVETLDELYQAATPARYLFETILTSFLRRLSYEDDIELQNAARTTFVCAPLKDKEACKRKARRSHVSKVFDVVRGTLICASEASLAALCDALDEDEFITVVRTKNRFQAPAATGCRDLLASIRVDVAATLLPQRMVQAPLPAPLPVNADGSIDMDKLEAHVTAKLSNESTVAHRCELRITLEAFAEADAAGLKSYEVFADYFATDPAKRTLTRGPARHDLLVGLPTIDATKAALLRWAYNVHGRSPDQLANLDVLFRCLGDPESSIELRERAVLAAAMKAGSTSRDHATHLTHLALALSAQKRHAEAAAILEDAMRTWADVGTTGTNAGKGAAVRARLTEELLHAGDAENALVNARTVAAETRDACTLLALARCLRLSKLYDEAEGCLLNALALDEAAPAKFSRRQARCLYELAACLAKRGDPARAEECVARYEESIELFERLGDEELGLAFQGLANVHRSFGDADRARDAQVQAARCLGEVLGRDHFLYNAMGRACDVLNDMPDPIEEDRLHRDTEDILRREVRCDAQNLGKDHLQTAEARTRLAEFLRATDRAEQALPYYRQALSTIERRLGTKHAACCGARRKLARCLVALHKLGEASSILKRAVDLALAAFGRDHVEVALSLCQHAEVVLKLGHEAKALALFQRAHAIHETRPRSELLDASNALNQLADEVEKRKGPRATRDLFRRRAIEIASLAYEDGALEQAEPLEKMLKNKVEEGSWAEVLDLSSRALISRRKGTDAQALALALDRKATALQALGRAAEAEPLLREALAIHKIGSFEAGTATAHLASAVRAAGRPAEAAPLLHEAIAAHEAALGADHPGTVRLDREAARLVTAYAATLAPDGGGEPLDEDEESQSTLAPVPAPTRPTPASGGRGKPMGGTPASPPIPTASTEAALRAAVAAAATEADVADASKRLASYYLHRGEARRSIAPARRVVELREKLLGTDHPNVAASMDFLGRCLGAAGEVREAESLLRRAVGGLARCLGGDHPAVGASLSNLAAVVQKRGATAYRCGDYASASGARNYAEALYRRALGVFDRDPHTPPPTTLTALRNLGDCLVENGKPAAAAPVLGRVVRLRERLEGDATSLLPCVEDYAAMLHDAGNHADAEKQYRRALQLSERAFGDSLDAIPARENLGALLWDSGQVAAAESEYREVLARLERLFDGAHPDAAATCHDLGEVLVELGRAEEGRPFLARALEGYRAIFNQDHPDAVAVAARLGGDLSEPLPRGHGHRPKSTHRKGRGSRRSKAAPVEGVPEAPRP